MPDPCDGRRSEVSRLQTVLDGIEPRLFDRRPPVANPEYTRVAKELAIAKEKLAECVGEPPSLPPLPQPEELTLASGRMVAGDVSGNATVVVRSNGTWAFLGSVDDSGVVLGDAYSFAVVSVFKGADGKAFGFMKEGTLGGLILGPSRSESWTISGSDSWVAANFASFKASGFRFILTKRASLGQQLLAFGLTGVVLPGGGMVGVG